MRGWMMRLIGCAGFLVVGVAQVAASDSPAAPMTYCHQMTRKLGRGAANVVTAPLELIRKPFLVGQDDGGVAGVTVGIVQGVGAAIIREAAGLVEVVTFPVPFPNHFQPLVMPEFVYANGDWVP